MRLTMTAALTLALLAAPVLARATEGLSGATVGATASGSDGARHARFEEWCRSEPARCEELRARRAEQREKCKADPKACRAERQARFAERFKQADTDGDGTLSRAEAEKGMPRLARRFDAIDADKDDRVTRDEIEAARKARASRRHKSRDS